MRAGSSDADKQQAVVGNVESMAAATIVGWAVGVRGEPVDVEVRAAGRPVPQQLRREDRADVRAAHPGRRAAPDGFAIELDSSVWQAADADGAVPIDILLDGVAFPAPGRFDLSLLDDWWQALVARPAADERERQALRFLAHVASAGGPGRLAAAVAAAVRQELTVRGLLAAGQEEVGVRQVARAQRQQVRLERFSGVLLEGWASDPALEPQRFSVFCNGREIACRVERLVRVDVQRALGAATSGFGFRIELPPEIWAHADAQGRLLVDACVEGRRLAPERLELDPDRLRALVRAPEPLQGDVRQLALLERHAAALAERGLFGAEDLAALATVAAAIDPAGSRHLPATAARGADLAPHVLRGVLESTDDLVLAGWVLDETEGGERLGLLCNGCDIACHVLRTNREDVREALGVAGASEFLGFEIQLPPAIWRHADAQGACVIEMLANGRLLPFAPLRLDAAALGNLAVRRLGDDGCQALRRADPEAWRGRALTWLLVQHVAASGGVARLAPEARQALQAAAGWIELAERHGLAAAPATGAARDERALQRRVWRLQRRLNALLVKGGRSVREAIELILADVDAVGAVRTQLLLSLVPLVCEQPEALALVEAELPLDVQAWHAARGDNWQRSLYLLGLARAQRFDDACTLLERIVVAPAQGWLNTDCIAFALRAALEPSGDEPSPRERFVDLVLALLGALPGGYWSRQQDRHLVEAAAMLVRASAAWPQARALRCRETALDHYGLVPSFWGHLDRLGAPMDAELARAREDFECVHAAFLALDDPGAAWRGWREAAERLRLQQLRGRRDAAQALRELMLAETGRARAAGTDEDLSWRFVLEGLGAGESRRLDAFPLARPGAAEAAPGGSLWPTPAAPPEEGRGPTNRLDLRSPRARVAALAQARVLVVCVVRNERMMLPHFLAHYRRLGATHFVFVDNDSSDGTAAYLEAQPDVVLYAADTDYRDSHYGVAWQQAVLAAHGAGRWAIVADADEFLVYRDWEHTPLTALLDRLDAGGHDAAEVLMLDLYPRGALSDTDFERSPPAAADHFDREPLLDWRLGKGLYSNSRTWLSALRHRLIPHSPPNAFTAQKLALLRHRPWVRLSEGLHFAAGLAPAPEPLFFAHYKYHAGFRAKVLLEIERKQHYDGASEYAHYLAMVARPDASLHAPDVSVRLVDSRALPAIPAADVGAAPAGS